MFLIGHRSQNPRFSFSIETTNANGKAIGIGEVGAALTQLLSALQFLAYSQSTAA